MAAALTRLADVETRTRHQQSCAGKRWYFTRAEAQAVFARWSGPRTETLEPYRCTTCGWWHHGNRPTD
jgi:hypothetical protein